MESAFYDKEEGGVCRCRLCPRHCRILPSQRGWCRTRWNDHGTLKALTYGLVTSAALDPIEKKPLAYFHPGAVILSLGSWGCNMNCAFCQNFEISQEEPESRKVSPDDVLRLARALTAEGNIGVAWTYNEPTLSFEFIRDTAPLIKEAGLMNVMVSNGFISKEALEALLPLIDAWNIDLKGWHPDFYKTICGAARNPVLETIQRAHEMSHVELTNLVIPKENDDPQCFEDMVRWIGSLSPAIPLHITRFFPRWRMADRPPTPVSTLVSLGEIARKYLNHVKIGNVSDRELAAYHWRNE
ncbi:AmmeMemoRadiSam system radical SAM enzyme [uncultured Dialister sp.]|jgi:pyruvate formate lyase activating enzyme|uniref:AmmeMemoRadiSam system radical SAM enzyme n=1 Tax=uncultured Dialister sp. TaxID=278064 RepID=UPI0025CDFEC6|nr:AmmeMemoRadiSam system radical SAM enzyme [uncultured Dialister sp.]